ncbi:MAG: DEAD/DEAH box helicase family protein, partial [Bacilli bacterium]|nr:DEAD/DEAH box helicase family protein [Bacilli bacterium]
MAIKLKDFQLEAVNNLKPGKILCGDVGSGKSLTSLAYYFKYNGFNIKDIESTLANKKIKEEKKFKNLYIITTPQKRDKHEWDLELARFCLDLNKDNPIIIIDSWNNIKKYINICNSFFIFDEQRVVGSGAWVKAFLKITKSNDWILLSATPGDTYMDYVPVMIANKFYKNKTEFIYNHVIYNRFTKYPKIDKYIRTEIIDNHINKLLVNLKKPETKIYHITELHCRYDIELYNKVIKDRWNPFEAKPIQTSSEFCKILRTINNSNIDRLNYVRELYFKHKKIIVFYNFDFELDLILQLKKEGIVV